MIAIEDSTAGAILPIRAQAGARRNAFAGLHAGMLKVAVTQPAEKGRANLAIAKLLAASLEIKPGQIALVSGATSTRKRFLIRGIQAAELHARLMQVLLDAGLT